MTVYLDIETDVCYTVEELKDEYKRFKELGYTEAGDFEEYLDNCLTINNGTLEPREC